MNLEQLEAYRANEPVHEHNGIPLETWEKLPWPSGALHNDKRLLAREAQAILRALDYAKINGFQVYRDEVIRDSDDKCTNYRVWFRPEDKNS